MWWTINRMKMSLQLFRSDADKCPHTLVLPKAVALTGTLKGGMPWCPIPLPACRKGVKVSLLSGVSVCCQGPCFSAALGCMAPSTGEPRFSAALRCMAPSTGEPHSCHGSLGYNHSRNTVQTRWHHALCSCWTCKVSDSPELLYLLCPKAILSPG